MSESPVKSLKLQRSLCQAGSSDAAGLGRTGKLYWKGPQINPSLHVKARWKHHMRPSHDEVPGIQEIRPSPDLKKLTHYHKLMNALKCSHFTTQPRSPCVITITNKMFLMPPEAVNFSGGNIQKTQTKF